MDQNLAAKTDATLELLRSVAQLYGPAAFANSLGAEDMVITDLIATHRLDIEMFTIDTGRLHGDTLDLVREIELHYGCEIRRVAPESKAVDGYVTTFGRDAFYSSVDLRKRCCEIRKVEPLKRALAGKKAWLTGLRREQSVTRTDLSHEEFDAIHGIAKVNPLADWSEQDVWTYIRGHEVPYNRLHDEGYRSIGCAPCTRPVVAGEDLRAGRWWWEHPESRECGLHVAPDGRLVRAREAA